MNKYSGFSLIELIIVIAVLGVLSSIAYPSYVNMINKSHRTSAMGDLLNIHLALEKSFREQKEYNFDIVSKGTCDFCITDTSRYRFTIDTKGSGYDAYVVTATPINEQSTDMCSILTVNKMAQTGASKNACW